MSWLLSVWQIWPFLEGTEPSNWFSLALLSCITAKHKGKRPPCTKSFGFMAPSRVVKCWNQHRDLAVFSGFDTSISNSSTKVLAEKHSHGYSIKNLQALGISSDFYFSGQEKVAMGFIQSDTRPKEAETGITLMLEVNLGDTLELGFLLWLRNSSFLTEYDSKSPWSPDRIWRKIGPNLTGPGNGVYFMMVLLRQWTEMVFL